MLQSHRRRSAETDLLFKKLALGNGCSGLGGLSRLRCRVTAHLRWVRCSVPLDSSPSARRCSRVRCHTRKAKTTFPILDSTRRHQPSSLHTAGGRSGRDSQESLRKSRCESAMVECPFEEKGGLASQLSGRTLWPQACTLDSWPRSRKKDSLLLRRDV